MTNDDYNNYMLNLYRDCTLKVSNEFSISSSGVNRLFLNAATVFNMNIASELLSQIPLHNDNIIKNLESYPYMFWKTSESDLKIHTILNKLNEKYSNEINDIVTFHQSSISNFKFKVSADPIEELNYTSKIEKQINEMFYGGIAPNGNVYNEGLFQRFAHDIYKTHTILSHKVDIVKNIEEFSYALHDKMTTQNINMDFSHFPDYIKKVFSNTLISEKINNINFEDIFSNKKQVEHTIFNMR